MQTTGTAGNDTLSGTTGDDSLAPLAGNDLVLYSGGNDVILADGSLNTGTDTLMLSQYRADQVTFAVDGYDLLIQTPDGTIRLEYQLRYEAGHERGNIEQIVFAEGILSAEGIRQRALDDQSGEGADLVTGTVQADTLSAGLGDDTIAALAGNDVLFYEGGHDLILGDGQINSGMDTLVLSQYRSDQVRFDVDGYDLLVHTPDGTIRLEYQLRYEAGHERGNIEQIVFSDGGLSAEGIRQRALDDQASAGDDLIFGTYQADTLTGGAGHDTIAALAGNDVIVYDGGNDVILGDQYFNTGTDTLVLAQYTLSQLQFSVSGYDVLIATPDGTIRLEYQLRHETGHERGNIEQIVLENGVLDAAAIRDLATGGQGADSDDMVTGTPLADTLRGGGGNDTIAALGGNDVIVYDSGDDVILGNAQRNTGTDLLVLSQYDADQVSFAVEGFDVLVTTPDGVIRLEHQLRHAPGHAEGNIEAILFADGTLDAAGLHQRALNDQGGPGHDSVTGTHLADSIAAGAGDDTIASLGGDDILVYQGGNDVILGTTQINSGTDLLQLGQYRADQVRFSVSGMDMLIATPDGVIRLENQMRHAPGHAQGNIEWVQFADGMLGQADLRHRAVNDPATDGPDLMTGTQWGDMISGGLGHDTLAALAGNDTLTYEGGNDVILGNQQRNNGFDTLLLTQFAADEVRFDVDGFDALIETPDGVIRLEYQLRHAPGHADLNMEQIVFENGALTAAGLLQRVVQDQTSEGHDLVTGTIFGDTIAAGAGHDSLAGLAGDDVFLYQGGNDVILGNQQRNTGSDTLVLSQFTMDQVTLSASGFDMLIGTSEGVIRLEHQLRNPVGHANGNIEQVIFADGTLTDSGLRARMTAQPPAAAPAASVQKPSGADLTAASARATPMGEAEAPSQTGGATPSALLATVSLALTGSDGFAFPETGGGPGGMAQARLSSYIAGDEIRAGQIAQAAPPVPEGEGGTLIDLDSALDAFLSPTQLAALDDDQLSIC